MIQTVGFQGGYALRGGNNEVEVVWDAECKMGSLSATHYLSLC